ncbi:MAG: RluA family pseudouridine synthase [Nitrospinota bacterium]|nr:RluA family pseudouridine synthase [Nitrospinota bacterium]
MNQDRIFEFRVCEKEKNIRVDLFLSQKNIGLSRSQIKKMIDNGFVLSGTHSLKAKYRIRDGEQIKVIIPPSKKLKVEVENIPLDIVYEDASVIVINKPPGMVVHPAAGNYTGTMVNALLYHCKDLSGIGGVERPGIVHRLDKDTSGLLMVAKDDISHQSLTRQLQERTIVRKYIAIVHGVMKTNSGTINKEIGRHVKDRKKMSTIIKKGREAVSSFRVLERFSSATLVEAVLKTGRTHQIRVHLSSIGYPVLGDKVYGGKKVISTAYIFKRQALHAAVLGFHHPKTGKYLEFNSPLPDDMQEAISKLEKEK